MDSNKKICTNCKRDLPNNEDYFYLDNAKVRLGHYIVLSAKCKECSRLLRKKPDKLKRDKLKKEYGSAYQYRKTIDPDFNKKINMREKRYTEKRKLRRKEVLKERPKWYLKILEKDREKHKIESNEMSDYYISKLIAGKKGDLNWKDIIKNESLIKEYRLNLTLKRELSKWKN
jgi:hypothetical protein